MRSQVAWQPSESLEEHIVKTGSNDIVVTDAGSNDIVVTDAGSRHSSAASSNSVDVSIISLARGRRKRSTIFSDAMQCSPMTQPQAKSQRHKTTHNERTQMRVKNSDCNAIWTVSGVNMGLTLQTRARSIDNEALVMSREDSARSQPVASSPTASTMFNTTATTRDTTTRNATTRDATTRDTIRDATTRDATRNATTRDATTRDTIRDTTTKDATTRDTTRDATTFAPPPRVVAPLAFELSSTADETGDTDSRQRRRRIHRPRHHQPRPASEPQHHGASSRRSVHFSSLPSPPLTVGGRHSPDVLLAQRLQLTPPPPHPAVRPIMPAAHLNTVHCNGITAQSPVRVQTSVQAAEAVWSSPWSALSCVRVLLLLLLLAACVLAAAALLQLVEGDQLALRRRRLRRRLADVPVELATELRQVVPQQLVWRRKIQQYMSEVRRLLTSEQHVDLLLMSDVTSRSSSQPSTAAAVSSSSVAGEVGQPRQSRGGSPVDRSHDGLAFWTTVLAVSAFVSGVGARPVVPQTATGHVLLTVTSLVTSPLLLFACLSLGHRLHLWFGSMTSGTPLKTGAISPCAAPNLVESAGSYPSAISRPLVALLSSLAALVLCWVVSVALFVTLCQLSGSLAILVSIQAWTGGLATFHNSPIFLAILVIVCNCSRVLAVCIVFSARRYITSDTFSRFTQHLK